MTFFTEKSIICGASVGGKNHQQDRTNNQDCYMLKKSSIGAALCVCDGVGSEQYSSHGSRAACRATLKVFKLYYKKYISKDSVGLAIEKYYRMYVRKEYWNSACTTCLFCFVYNNSEVLVGQAGDGIILIREDDKLIVFQNQNKSFLNEVYPLNCNRNYNAWKIKNVRFSPERNNKLDVLLATDGVSDDVFPDKREYFMNHFITSSQNEGSAGIKRILENWEAPGSVDDKTVATFSWRR